MASTVSSNKLKSNLAVKSYDFDPDGTSATDVAWVDLSGYENFMVGFFRTIGTGTATIKILANPASDGSGQDVEVKAYSGSAPDAVGDQVYLECTADEILSLGSGLRYVSANITFGTGTDEGVVTYIRANPRFATSGLTADVIA